MAGNKVRFSNHEYEVANIYYWLIILIAIILALGVTALMSFYTIAPGENGVVVRLGKLHQVNGPGVHWKMPWGIDKLRRIKVDYQYSAEFGFQPAAVDSNQSATVSPYSPEARLLTGDLKMIDLQWVVHYRIQDPVAYLFNVDDPEQTIRAVGLAAMRSAVGDFSFHEVFQTERRAVAKRAMNYMQAKFDQYNLGVTVQHVQLKEASPALPVQEKMQIAVEKPIAPAKPIVTGDSTRIDSVKKGW